MRNPSLLTYSFNQRTKIMIKGWGDWKGCLDNRVFASYMWEPGLVSRTHIENWTWRHTCHFSAGKKEADGSLNCWPNSSVCLASARPARDLVNKQTKVRWVSIEGWHLKFTSLWSPHSCTHLCMYGCTQAHTHMPDWLFSESQLYQGRHSF